MTPKIRVLDEMGAMNQSALRDHYIVNCADQCPNYYEGSGFQYHKIQGWIDKADNQPDDQRVLDGLGDLKNKMLEALNVAMDKINKGYNVVFHCLEGKSRSLSMAILAETLREFEQNPGKFSDTHPGKFGDTPLPNLIQTLRINRLAFFLKRGFGLSNDQDSIEKHIALEAKAIQETFEKAGKTIDIDAFIRELTEKFTTLNIEEKPNTEYVKNFFNQFDVGLDQNSLDKAVPRFDTLTIPVLRAYIEQEMVRRTQDAAARRIVGGDGFAGDSVPLVFDARLDRFDAEQKKDILAIENACSDPLKTDLLTYFMSKTDPVIGGHTLGF